MPIFTVTFSYEARTVPPRCRHAVTKRFRAEQPVEIIDLSDAQAPVALSFRDFRRDLAIYQMRWDGEHLYRPILSPQGQMLDADTFAALAMGEGLNFRGAPVWSSYPFPRSRRTYGNQTEIENVFSLASFEEARGRLESDKQVEARAETSRRASKAAVIDGHMFYQTVEPRWHLDIGDYTAKLKVATAAPEPQAAGNIELRLDHGHEALEILRQQPRCELVFDPDRLTIHIPEALGFDEASASEAMLFGPVFKGISGSIGAHEKLESIQAWLDIRAAREAFLVGDRNQLEAGYQALRRYVDSGDDRSDQIPSYSRIDIAKVKAHLEAYERIVMHGSASRADMEALAV